MRVNRSIFGSATLASLVGSFVAGTREEWDRVLAVPWFGDYCCTRAFLPMLRAADQGLCEIPFV